jgi:hypothetical protein
MKLTVGKTFSAIALAALIAACSSESPLQPSGSPLAGLNKAASGDTSNTTHSPTGTGPGYFRGTVLGPALPGSGNDSLNTAPRIAGVVVAIYERKAGESDADAVVAGEAKGSVSTGADGMFTLPTLPSGEYIVTFTPPASSGYYGVYAFGPLRENSSEYPWWIVLGKK